MQNLKNQSLHDASMTYLYVKALHIIFVVTWFAGLFYIVRLFIYNREAHDKAEPERKILQDQFGIMIRRLWFGITWPSCILTVLFGAWTFILYGSFPLWLMLKICFVAGLLIYHLTLHAIYRQQSTGIFKYTSQQLRLWNEVVTLFLVSIIFLVILKSALTILWGIAGIFILFIILKVSIKVYKSVREAKSRN